jgi:hypothetical protein
MEYNCKLLHDYKETLEILTVLLNNDVSMKIMEYIDDQYNLKTTYEENIDKIYHFMKMSMINKGIPNKISFKLIGDYWRRDLSFTLIIKLLKDDKEIFTLNKYHCDYEWYRAYDFNDFINYFIKKYNLIIINEGINKIVENGIVCIPDCPNYPDLF